MIAYLRARSLGGRLLFRLEDLDHPRDKPGAADGMVEDLRWLGFEWDEESVQSRRTAFYREALESIRDKVYPCVCSRRDVETAQSAPHAGEQLRYPGTCRGRFATWDEAYSFSGRLPCWRFAATDETVEIDDVFAGAYRQNVYSALGDFPLARNRDGAGYTLASVVDDALSGVTEVVRGDDLLPATPSHVMLQRALGFPTPAYCHVPLVVGADGLRLAKRHGDTRICAYRQGGTRPGAILGLLAWSCGWADRDEELSLDEILPRFNLSSIPREPFAVRPKCGEGACLHVPQLPRTAAPSG